MSESVIKAGPDRLSIAACDECIKRTWLLERLAGHLALARDRVSEVLALDDDELVTAVGGKAAEQLAGELERFGTTDANAVRTFARSVGLELVCRCEPEYPDALRDLSAPPAVLAVAGGVRRLVAFCDRDCVAVVGSRRISDYGRAVTAELAGGLAAAGLTVVSGMAFGVDSAAHEAALRAGGKTLAVLPVSPQRPYPATKAALHRRLVSDGVVISELVRTESARGWALQARNRMIAALASVTVMVEGSQRSGALITVTEAGRLNRAVLAVPGPLGAPQSAGPNMLLAKRRPKADGPSIDVRAVRGAQDVLDLIYGEGIVDSPRNLAPVPTGADAGLLDRIRRGDARLSSLDVSDLARLSVLELNGWVTRGPGGGLMASGP